MSVSRAEPARRLGLGLTAAALVVAAGAACAQTPGPPVRLGPGSAGVAEPAVKSSAVTVPAIPTAGGLVPDGAGVLSLEQGGLGPDLWAGSSLAVVERLLAELPVGAPSPSQRRLTLRLLLSTATPPADDREGNRLAGLRLGKLMALGAGLEAAQLAAVIPGAVVTGLPETGLAQALTLARAENGDPDQRVAAAERAAAAGVLSETDLTAAYAAVRFSPAALARPLSASEKGGRGRALVYQALVHEPQAVVRAELLRRAFELLEPGQAAGAVAAVPLTILAGLPADVTTSWLAPAAARLLLAQQQNEAAEVWLSVPAQPAEAVALGRLWPLTVLAAKGPSATDLFRHRLNDWLDLVLADSGAAAATRRGWAAGVLALLQAAGEPVSEAAWSRVADPGGSVATALPAAGLWQSFQRATASRRLGEMVLTALVMLGEAGPVGLPPVVLAQLVAALQGAGLTAEARGLAREALAAQFE